MDCRPAQLTIRENLPFVQCYFLSSMGIYILSPQVWAAIISPVPSMITKKT
jgi:hypothetical protein